jgi:hypothetical protein
MLASLKNLMCKYEVHAFGSPRALCFYFHLFQNSSGDRYGSISKRSKSLHPSAFFAFCDVWSDVINFLNKSFVPPNYPKDARADSRLRTPDDCSPLPGLPILKDKSLSWSINLNPESLSAINQTNWRPEMSTAAIFAETQNNVWMFFSSPYLPCGSPIIKFHSS